MTVNDEHLFASFGSLVGQTARVWRRAADKRLQPFGLTEATWLPLLWISRAHKPMLQKDLAAVLSLDNSSVVRLIDNLEAAGLVRRREGEDRRAKEILLTDAGRDVVGNVERVVNDLRKEIMADLAKQDIEIATKLLDQLSTRLASIAEESLT